MTIGNLIFILFIIGINIPLYIAFKKGKLELGDDFLQSLIVVIDIIISVYTLFIFLIKYWNTPLL